MPPNDLMSCGQGARPRARALLHPQLPPSRGSPPETLHPFFPIARAHSVIIITAQLPSLLQSIYRAPQVWPALGSFETSKANKPGARFV